MEDLLIPAGKVSPGITFKRNGNLRIEGRSMLEDPRKFYKSVFSWIRNLEDAGSLHLDVKLEYFNTSSSKLIMELLNRLISVAGKNKISIVWHYEDGDDDMFEAGKYFEQLLNIKFVYQPYAEEISF
jgi:hypothetical protein